VRYAFIKEQRGSFSLSALCRAMQVSPSGYRAWSKRTPCSRDTENTRLTERICSLFRASGQTYGSPRLWDDLRKEGEQVSRKRVAQLMRLAGLRATLPKRWITTTDSKHAFPVADNLLNREFGCATPNAKWSTDITSIWTLQGWLYLAVILDLFSRRIVGWATSATIDRSLVLVALSQAQQQRKPVAGLVCHSDRGSQYASHDYQTALKEAKIVCSMSRRGNCWDNAPTESFFATIKKELIHRTRFVTRQEAHKAIFAYIEIWYNRRRKHSTLGYLSPEAFERKHQKEQQHSQSQASGALA
jgi:putative transposase